MAEIQKNIGTTEAPLSVPEGSPGDLLKNNPTAYNQQYGQYGNVNTVNTTQPSPQTVNATPYTNQQPSPTTNTSDLKAGLQAAVQSGQPAPDSMGQGTSAVQAFSTTAAATPTFYKPDSNSQQVVNAKGEKLSYDQYIAQGGKADFSNVQAGNAPVYKPTPIQGIEAQLAQDPGYQQLLNDYSEYNNAINQTKSLADTYNQIASSSGLDSINTQLLNTKKVIEGTEEDIRNEIKAVNGFASDSQVLALASARNKTLIKNYNALVDQQTNIQNKVNTMVNLASQDRTYALQVAFQKLQIDEQLLNYRQKFIQNAQEAYKNTISAIGYDGLYALVDGDPKSISLIEKTLGLPSGGLNQAATTANKQRLVAQEKQQLELQQTKTSIEKTKAEIAQLPLEATLKKAQTAAAYASAANSKAQADQLKIQNEAIKSGLVPTAVTGKPLSQTEAQALGYGVRTLQAAQIIKDKGNQFATKLGTPSMLPNFLKSSEQQQYEQAKRNFVNAVLRRESGAAIAQSEFDNAAEQYFPKYGDSQKTLEQKEQNRNAAISNLLREAGQGNVNPTKLTVTPDGELVEITK